MDIGYGRVPEGRTTGATSVIYTSDLNLSLYPHVEDLLRLLPGVTVRQNEEGWLEVRVRGSRSLSGNNEPLFVVDGLAISFSRGLVRSLSVRDIESISVTKDATNPYGARGANGVIFFRTHGSR